MATPKTEPITPWYLPRSLSGTTSAITAIAVTMMPPAPRPWIAREPTSHSIELAIPHSAEPARNSTTLIRNIRLRP